MTKKIIQNLNNYANYIINDISSSKSDISFKSSSGSGGSPRYFSISTRTQGNISYKQPTIFSKNIIKTPKLISSSVIMSDVGEIQYFPAASKEWKDSVYHFNKNTTKNLPVQNQNIYRLMKGYFNMYFNHLFILKKHLTSRKRRGSLNKIYLSKPEIKHTNSKAVITLYTFNREKKTLLKKIRFWVKFTKKIAKILRKSYKIIIKFFLRVNMKRVLDIRSRSLSRTMVIIDGVQKNEQDKSIANYYDEFYSAHFGPDPARSQAPRGSWTWDALAEGLKISKSKAKAQASLIIKRIFKKELLFIRRYKLRLNLNKYKFEDKFLSRFSKFIGKLYNKQIEFNIINLKSIVFNTDLFTEISTLKIKKKKGIF